MPRVLCARLLLQSFFFPASAAEASDTISTGRQKETLGQRAPSPCASAGSPPRRSPPAREEGTPSASQLLPPDAEGGDAVAPAAVSSSSSDSEAVCASRQGTSDAVVFIIFFDYHKYYQGWYLGSNSICIIHYSNGN